MALTARVIDPPVLSEEAVFFEAGSETLLGVLSAPAGTATGPAVILLSGGAATVTGVERNRFYVTLCRRLAAAGRLSFRFDFHGVGDSTGSATFRLDRPFVDDLHGAVAWLTRRTGITDYVLVGSCFGGRTALSASDSLPGLKELVLLAPPLRDYGLSEPKTSGWRAHEYVLAVVQPRRVLGAEKVTVRRYLRFIRSGLRIAVRRLTSRLAGASAKVSWISRRFLQPLSSLHDRGVPVLLVYGTEDEEYRDFHEASAGPLGRLLASSQTVQATILDGQVHGFTRVDSQATTLELLMEWITTLAATDATSTNDRERSPCVHARSGEGSCAAEGIPVEAADTHRLTAREGAGDPRAHGARDPRPASPIAARSGRRNRDTRSSTRPLPSSG